MWILNKPSLKDTIADIDNLILHCRALSDTDKPILEFIYTQYDKQKGYITSLQNDSISAEKAEAIKGQYDKTYKGLVHYPLRRALQENVNRCPYCSINQPSTLDHYMPQGQYPALAMCRLNLVPMCNDCNNKKREKPYYKFIHPYYQSFPKKAFLRAEAQVVNQQIIIKFRIDDESISKKELKEKLSYQTNEIDLIKRINKAASSFIEVLCADCHLPLGLGIDLWLKRRYNSYLRNFGRNDWRTAAISAIMNCPDINYEVIKGVATSHHYLNPGA